VSKRARNETAIHAAELATTLGGTATPFEARWQQMESADIVISSTSCPHTILSRDQAEFIARARHGRPLVIVDIAMPRDVDGAVGEAPGIFLLKQEAKSVCVINRTFEPIV
jgi:glutamyl-tRNA reductase